MNGEFAKVSSSSYDNLVTILKYFREKITPVELKN
jgi:hypothetical protein